MALGIIVGPFYFARALDLPQSPWQRPHEHRPKAKGPARLHPICYLEDLFVAPKARGHGIGRALIEDLLALAKKRHWSRLYWHTREGNVPARRLYDEFAIADDFVRYRLTLD